MPPDETVTAPASKPGPATTSTPTASTTAGTAKSNGDGRQEHDDAARERLLREYLDALLGDTPGYLHIAVGRDPYLNDKGKYQHRDWEQTPYDYPAQADEAVNHMLRAAPGADVYVCTSVMRGRTRAKGAAVERTRPHADVDHGRLDPEKVTAIGGWAISSGTPGHGHVYAETTEPLTITEYDILCRALGNYLGGADSKISDNDVLRPPGTYSQKATIVGGDPTPVGWLVKPSGIRHDKNALAFQLGVTLPEPGQEPWRAGTPGPGANGQAHRPAAGQPGDPFDLDTYWAVRTALAAVTAPPDRSGDTYRVVAACADAGLTLEQTRWAVRTRPDLAQRLDERKDDDVATSWDKIHADRQARITVEPEWPAGDPGPDEPPPDDDHRGEHNPDEAEGHGSEHDDTNAPTTWDPVDLGPWLRGEINQPQPSLGIHRSDGVQLIYPGREHAVLGETESGKTWLALACVAAELAAGNHVLYVHYEEGDPGSTIERLQLLGVDPALITGRLRFVAPARPVRAGWLETLLDPAPSLVDSRRSQRGDVAARLRHHGRRRRRHVPAPAHRALPTRRGRHPGL